MGLYLTLGQTTLKEKTEQILVSLKIKIPLPAFIMKAQKSILFALAAGLLVLQLTTPALARTSSTGTDSTESESTEDSTVELSANCIVNIINFTITQLNSVIAAVGLGAAACEVPCGAMGTPGQCVACIAAIIPPLPTIPSPDMLGCS